jgi:hypothetical protein
VQIAGYLRRFCCGRNAHVIPFRVPLMWRGVSPKKRLYARESEDPTKAKIRPRLTRKPDCHAIHWAHCPISAAASWLH